MHLGIVMAPRAAVGFKCPEQPTLPPPSLLPFHLSLAASLACAIGVPGCLLYPAHGPFSLLRLSGVVPAAEGTACAVTFGSCSSSFMELLLMPLERCLYRESNILQFFTGSSEMLYNLHSRHFDPEKWKKLSTAR